MDNHPIPQDVTGFQFKLIGSMTIKQFAYVGAGVVLSVIFFYSPLSWLIKYPLIPFFAIIGIALAFLPIAGRPMDLMVSYFIKAILKPNQFVYQKTGGSLSFMELNLQPVAPITSSTPKPSPRHSLADYKKEQQLLTYLYGTASTNNNPLDQKESQLISSLFKQPVQMSDNASTATLSAPPVTIPPISQSIPIANTSIPQLQPRPEIPTTETITTIVQKTPNLASTGTASANNTFQQNTQPSSTTLPAEMGFPNLIKGIIKDARGNVLSGILIDVLNKDQESVRAFKSNTLGQFMSATQLTNGSYTLTFEDPKNQHRFDSVHVDANGTILPALNIVSVDAREELRRSLFG